jgi:HisJ family histidinol phosphate phosphatase
MDNHLHTKFSDGKDSPRDMVITAVWLGYNQITFTDHVHRDSDWLDNYIAETAELKKEFINKITIKTGVEAKIINLDGDIDFDACFREKVDVILAAIHRIPIGNERYIKSSDVMLSNKAEIYSCVKEATCKAIANPLVDVLAHPFQLGADEIFRSLFSHEYCNYLRGLAINKSKYMEFNVSKYNGCVQENYWMFPDFKVWVGSDSHSVGAMIANSSILGEISLTGNKYVVC